MGIMFDVKSIYSTLSKNYQNLEIEIFKQLYEKGLVYRDHRAVFWSAEEKRIVEFEDMEEKSELADCVVVKIPVKSYSGESKFLDEEYEQKGKKIYFLGFLLEPWKYIGIRSLSINPNSFYCLAKIKGDYCICAYKRLPEIARRCGEKSPEILLSAKGSSFSDILLNDPIFKRDLPIILDKDVSEFFGTGINILSPAHDFNSERLARGYNLSLEGFLDDDNYIKPGLGIYFHNTHYSEGNYKIISKLKSTKFLIANWKFENMYYANKLTEERIVLRSIPSWFLSIDKNLKNECIKELSFTHFYPELNFDKSIDEKLKYQPAKLKKKKKKIEKINKGYKNIVEEIEEFDEWCISEINSWGVPIPYFTYKTEYLNKENKIQTEVLVNSEIIEHVKNLFGKHGSDIWWTWSVDDLLPEKYKGEGYKLDKGRENFDSGFDSSISWYSLLNNKLKKIYEDDEEILNGLNKDQEFQNYRIDIQTQKLSKDNKIDNSLIPNDEIDKLRTKEHIKDYNNQLKEFIVEQKNIYGDSNKSSYSTERVSENSEDEEEDSEKNSNSNTDNNNTHFIQNKKIKSLIPKNILFNHINFKCLNYSASRLFPADILIEANTQHTYWFIQSLMTSVSLLNQSCFRAIKTHGFIEDSSGSVLSTNPKKYIDPLDIIDGTIKMNFERKYGYGADTVRLFLLKNESDTNFAIFEELLEKSKSDLKELRKIARISLGLINDHSDRDFNNNFSFLKANILDQIIINEFIKFYSKLSESIQKLNFKEYYNQLKNFAFDLLYDFYINAVKNRIILKSPESLERRQAQFLIEEILYDLVKLLSPIIPFTCEEIYKQMKFVPAKNFNFIGLDDIQSLEEILEKFKFRFNEDFTFNVESLMIIRKEISAEIKKLSKSKKFPQINRNQINLIFFIENKDSYEFKILSSLGSNINDFFGVNTVSVISSDENQENELNVSIKTKTVSFRNSFSNLNSKEFVEFNIKYKIEKCGMHMCVRCFNHKCKEENKICRECQEDIRVNNKCAKNKSIVDESK
jgi:isoleucyl-tRNA synthetase